MEWWWIFGLLVLVVGLIYMSVADRDLATVTVEASSLVITPRGLNKLWALRGRLAVPVGSVTGVSVANPRELPKGLRFPGTAFPGLILAGNYLRFSPKEWSFYLIRGRRPVVLIELEGQRYKRLIVETADPNATVGALNRELGTIGG